MKEGEKTRSQQYRVGVWCTITLVSITSETVMCIGVPSRSLVYNHCGFNHFRDRHVHRIKMVSRMTQRHENVSGSFETPS
jgi:hypothetical protein